MIHFFRRIRKSLLEDSKFRKYLVYAIGEIALVMIGILLALQVNTWNENKNNAKLEKQYLIALQEEFNINMGKLKTLDTLLSNQIDAVQEYIQYTQPTKSDISPTRFSYLMQEGFRDTYNYSPASGVLKDLLNSGKINLIKNTKLRRILVDWESNHNRLRELENESQEASYDVVEILRTHGSFRNQMNEVFKALETGPSKFTRSNTDLLQMEVFENSIVYFLATTWRLRNVYYPNLGKKMKDVLSIIESELN